MRYEAFISYRHRERDAAVARALAKQLETYRVPAAVRKNTGQAKIGRVFRDQDELPLLADLGEGIRQALRESEWLIVVCSPDLPLSKWCMAEIDYFMELGRKSRILTILTAGEPDESFPQQLRTSVALDGTIVETEPLAADVRAASARSALRLLKREKLRLLAPMLGVSYDDLHRRQRERFLRQVIAAGSAALLVMTIATLYVLRQNALIAEERNAVMAGRSRIYADFAEGAVADGNPAAAALLALEALPADIKKPERPYTAEARLAMLRIVSREETEAYRPVVRLAASESLTPSPDGRTAVARDGGITRVYDTETLRRIYESVDGAATPVPVYTSPADPAFRVTADRPLYNRAGNKVLLPYGDLTVLDAHSGEILSTGPFTEAGALAEFGLPSRCGARLDSSFEDREVFDLESGEILFRAESENTTAVSLLSPDERYYLLASYGGLQVWDTQSKALLFREESRKLFVEQGYSFFAPDSRHLLVTHREEERIPLKDGTHLRQTNYLFTVYELPAGKIVYTGSVSDRGVSFMPYTLPNYVNDFHAISAQPLFSPDGRLLLLPGGQNALRIIDLRRGIATATVSRAASGEEVWSACFSPDSRRVVVAAGTAIKIHDALNGALLETLTPGGVSASVSADGQRVFSASGHIFERSAAGTETADVRAAGEAAIRGLSHGETDVGTAARTSDMEDILIFADDSRRAVLPGDGTRNACVLELPGGRRLFELANTASFRQIKSVDNSKPQGSVLRGGEDRFAAAHGIIAATDYSALAVWDAETGAELFRTGEGSPYFAGLRISADGSRVAAFYDLGERMAGGVRVYAARTGRLLCDAQYGNYSDAVAELDGDLTRCLYICDNAVSVFDLTGTRGEAAPLLFRLDDYPAGQLAIGVYSGHSAALSRDGAMLAIAHEKKNTVEIVDASAGERLREIPLAAGGADALLLSHDGARVTVHSSVGYLECYDTAGGELLYARYEPDLLLGRYAYSLDDAFLAGPDIRDAVGGEVLFPVCPPARPDWQTDEGGVVIPMEGGLVFRLPADEEAFAALKPVAREYELTRSESARYALE
ncbi:MAG: TIR domain-containing protein [Clostridiales Family XIII bacterium]|jgi:WD40 repeat protein|nr:TIR domain-containing protein [Clostridiales Family XIII bacterium]